MSVAFLLAGAFAGDPPSKWTVDYADSYCEARRAFGSGKTATTLHIKPPLDEAATTQLMFDHPVIELQGDIEVRAVVRFGNESDSFEAKLQPATGPQGFQYILDLPSAQATRLESAGRIEVKTRAKVNGAYDLEPSAPLFTALRRCVDDLKRRVGVDERVPATPASAPTGLGPLFSASKYWTAEFRKAKSNRIEVSLLIDASGAVRDCAIVEGTGSAALNNLTCQIFRQRVRYTPARTAAGKAVATLQRQSVDWRR